jgi:hypothetical protein
VTNPSAKVEVPHNSDATSILVWNGLVTRMRLIGGEKRSRARVDVGPRKSASQSLCSKLRHGSEEASDA